MTKRIAIGVALLSCAATATVATAAGGRSLTDLMQMSRMTVVAVDPTGGRFLCKEHHQWTAVLASDLGRVKAGDIVRVEREEDQPARLAVLRTAAEEISSPER